jgi:hypothetical protein
MALGIGSLAAGCSTVHESLGTSDAPCYVALPTASAAVGKAAHFDGVRLMKVSSVKYPRLALVLKQAGVDSGQVCLVAFTGTFSLSSVSHPSGRANGHLAVVVLRYPDGKLVSTVVLRRLPTRFGHSHL